MRLLLALALSLLFLWLYKAQISHGTLHGNACEAVSMSEAAASLLLSPLSLYIWLTSTLLRLVLSIPTLVLSSAYHSLLLLLAWPWCIACICVSLLLTCLHVTLYLLHLALVVGVVAILTLTQHKMANSGTTGKKMLYCQKKLEKHHPITRLRMFGRRVGQQG